MSNDLLFSMLGGLVAGLLIAILFTYMYIRREKQSASGIQASARAEAEKLVAEGRRFEKPLRFDADDVTFPDFWLKDVGAPIPMEVWGMTSTDYQARKAEKSTYYDETYGKDGWWGWNGAAGDDLPEFPARLDQVDLDQDAS